VRGSRLGLAPFDKNVIDGAVDGVGTLVGRASRAVRGWQTGLVQTYALAVVIGVVAVVAILLFV
jgi:NADH-quinone oxidoreductase subunit L